MILYGQADGQPGNSMDYRMKSFMKSGEHFVNYIKKGLFSCKIRRKNAVRKP